MIHLPEGLRSFSVMLQRNSFGPRLTARAADLWRAIQDVVVDESTAVGWPPERYEKTNSMFVVRTMTVEHSRELRIGEPLTGMTWVSRARRSVLFTREVRLFSGASNELVTTATQEWAYLSRDLTPTKPGPELYAAFPILTTDAHVELVAPPVVIEPAKRRVFRFRFRSWHTSMDPFGHVNHPDYLDFCDEAVSRVLANGGLDAQRLVARAESVHFKAPVGADVEVEVETTLVGTDGDAATFDHRINSFGKVCALATTVRSLVGAQGLEWVKVFE